ncbi:MAG: MSMEG_0565 family glycosyltransferase, partial [Deltaproteobacteria bacterium]|nr:MSMEG_0565 family glycosyltransferase [Deltaproteobacteria bacterium]
MKSLKIALFTYSTKPRGGVVHTLRLAEELSRLKHKVHVYTLSTGNGFYRNVDLPHTLIPCPVVNYKSIDEKIESYIRIYYEYLSSINENYDIYHAEDCISANALLELRNNGLIKSFVRTVHHLDDFTSKSLIDCQLNSILEPDHVMVVSKYWERKLRSDYSLDPLLTQNGVDVDRFLKLKGDGYSRESAKSKFSVGGCRVILSIGGIEPRKNTLTTLRAFNIAKSHFTKKGERLVWLIGGGETLFDYRAYRDEFFTEIKGFGLGLDEDIIVLGNIPEDSMAELYRAADAFVFPSIKEGWGLVVLEAMASGVPVIASRIEPLTEYLENENNSILISPIDHNELANEIIRLIEVNELRQKLIANGVETAKKYSWRNTALMHSDCYY